MDKSLEIKEYVKIRKQYLKDVFEQLNKKPKLLIIQVNNDEASNAYVKGKIKDLTSIGAEYIHLLLDINTKEEELLKIIEQYNNDDSIDGILVQLPLPKGINEKHVKEKINPSKDVDGFHPMSSCVACTPKGIVDYLEFLKYDFVDKNALIIGRSNIVGRPLAKILLDKSANVTVIHSKTSKENKEKFLKMADLIIVAVGKKYFLNENYLKSNAYIIDVGINRIDGKLYGDVIPNLNVSLQTPVPGGVGLLTRLSLLENLLLCYKERRGKNNAI